MHGSVNLIGIADLTSGLIFLLSVKVIAFPNLSDELRGTRSPGATNEKLSTPKELGDCKGGGGGGGGGQWDERK